MIDFIVCGSVALISIAILLGLSIRHSVNSFLSWVGAFLIFTCAVMTLTLDNPTYNSLFYGGFGFGVLLYIIGLYLISDRYIEKAVSQNGNAQAKTISDILEVAAARESLMELLNYSLDRFLEVFSLNSGAIHIFHHAKNKLVMGAYRGLIPSYAKKLEMLDPGQTAIGRAVQNRRVLIIRDLSVSPDYRFFGGRAERYSFLAVAPIIVDDKCWGVITFLGRRKYHRGIFTIDQLEQFGYKLGQALVLGRENRRMSAAYNHLNKVIEYYNGIINHLKESSVNNIPWNDIDLFKSLEFFKARLFDKKSFAIIKYTGEYAQCLYLQNRHGHLANGLDKSFKKVKTAGLPSAYLPGEYFTISDADLSGLIPQGIFSAKRLAAYGYQYDDTYKAIVVVDEFQPRELATQGENLTIIGNILTVAYLRKKWKADKPIVKNEDDKRRETLRLDLASILASITDDIQLLHQQAGQYGQPVTGENLTRWLSDIEESALKGLHLLKQTSPGSNPNDIINSIIEKNKLDVAFYPGMRLPEFPGDPDDFKALVSRIISEAIAGNNRIRLKTSSENSSIAITIEGKVGEDFPSAGVIEQSRRHNIMLNVITDTETINLKGPDDMLDLTTSSQLNVLTIEDKSVIIDLLDVFFEKIGCNNTSITTGEAALAYIKSKFEKGENIDIAIIDMTLEDISGLELCRKIKQMDSSIYTIIISSWGINLNQHTLNDAGVDAVLHKPFRLEQLKNVMPRKDLTDAT